MSDDHICDYKEGQPQEASQQWPSLGCVYIAALSATLTFAEYRMRSEGVRRSRGDASLDARVSADLGSACRQGD